MIIFWRKKVAIKKNVKVEINFPDINGEVLFDTLSDSRLVKAAISAYAVLVIEKWLNQNTNYAFNRHQLIPENVKEYDELQKYSQFYVNSCSELLKSDTLLTFNEALFLLLGLNPFELIFPPFNKLNLTNYSPPIDFPSSLECAFFPIKHYQILKRSSFLRHDGRILSEDLIELAKREGFFNEVALQTLNTEEIDNVKRKPSTINTQNLITKIAKTIIKDYPEIQKQILASDINKKLKEEQSITHLEDSTIERQYLNNFKKLKGIA